MLAVSLLGPLAYIWWHNYTTQPGDLSLILGFHMVAKENQLSQVFSDLQATHTKIKKKLNVLTNLDGFIQTQPICLEKDNNRLGVDTAKTTEETTQ